MVRLGWLLKHAQVGLNRRGGYIHKMRTPKSSGVPWLQNDNLFWVLSSWGYPYQNNVIVILGFKDLLINFGRLDTQDNNIPLSDIQPDCIYWQTANERRFSVLLNVIVPNVVAPNFCRSCKCQFLVDFLPFFVKKLNLKTFFPTIH